MAAAPRLSGARRLTRGSLAAALSVGTAVAAHGVAGHHSPHLLVVALALAVSLPLCTALAGLRLGRLRLTASVLVSQGVLHGLFSFLPASAASTVGTGLPAGDPHAGHGATSSAPAAASSAPEAGSDPAALADGAALTAAAADVGMVVAHLAAALLSIAVLRRGELLLQAFADLLALRPAHILLTPREALFGVPAERPTPSRPVPPLRELWSGQGPRPVRGPPAVA